MQMVLCGIYSYMNGLLLDRGKTVLHNYKIFICYRLAIWYASNILYTVIILGMEIDL